MPLTYGHLAEGLRYDPASQVTNILHKITATSAQINKADYLYNGVGNRTSLTDRRGTQGFGYDNLDRLTSASHPLLATPQAFAYDAVEDREKGSGVFSIRNGDLAASEPRGAQATDVTTPVLLVRKDSRPLCFFPFVFSPMERNESL